MAIWCRQAIYHYSMTLHDLQKGVIVTQIKSEHVPTIYLCKDLVGSCVTLKIRSRSKQYGCVSLVKIHQFLHQIGCRQAIFQNLSPCVTLKMGSRPPKSNQFLSLSQQYSCASLVKIHPFTQEIGCRQAIFQQSEPYCDLENGVKVTKI